MNGQSGKVLQPFHFGGGGVPWQRSEILAQLKKTKRSSYLGLGLGPGPGRAWSGYENCVGRPVDKHRCTHTSG